MIFLFKKAIYDGSKNCKFGLPLEKNPPLALAMSIRRIKSFWQSLHGAEAENIEFVLIGSNQYTYFLNYLKQGKSDEGMLK